MSAHDTTLGRTGLSTSRIGLGAWGLGNAASHPAVKAVLERFPGARIVDVRDPRAAEADTPATAAPETEYLPDGEPLFDDSEPDFDGIDF